MRRSHRSRNSPRNSGPTGVYIPPTPAEPVVIASSVQLESQRVRMTYDHALTGDASDAAVFILDPDGLHGGPFPGTNIESFTGSEIDVLFAASPALTLFTGWDIRQTGSAGNEFADDGVLYPIPQTDTISGTGFEINVVAVTAQPGLDALWEFSDLMTVVTPLDPIPQLEIDPVVGTWAPLSDALQDGPNSLLGTYAQATAIGDPWRVTTTPDNLDNAWRIPLPQSGLLV